MCDVTSDVLCLLFKPLLLVCLSWLSRGIWLIWVSSFCFAANRCQARLFSFVTTTGLFCVQSHHDLHGLLLLHCMSHARATHTLIRQDKFKIWHEAERLVHQCCTLAILNRHLRSAYSCEVVYWRKCVGYSYRHRCRSRQIFGGVEDFCSNFPKLARKVLYAFCPQIFSHKDHEDLFLVWPFFGLTGTSPCRGPVPASYTTGYRKIRDHYFAPGPGRECHIRHDARAARASGPLQSKGP